MTSPGTSACAWVAGVPTPTRATRAAATTATTTRRLPSRPTMTRGVSGGGEPSFRRNRSVDRVGRKSETTRDIACLHYKISTLARPATNEFDLPARPADPGDRQRLGRQRRHRQRVTAAVR